MRASSSGSTSKRSRTSASANIRFRRLKFYEQKDLKPEDLKMVLPEQPKVTKKDLTLPQELPKPDEISVASKHKQLDTSQLFAAEKPPVEIAKLASTPRINPDDLLPK